MKKIIIVFISITSLLYSMEPNITTKSSPNATRLLMAYLPTAPGNQTYFSQEQIDMLEKQFTSIQKYFLFLKNKAYENYNTTIYALCTINQKYDAAQNSKDAIFKEARALMSLLVTDHSNWKSNQATSFHPLLFLTHPSNNIHFIILNEQNWFDVKKGNVITRQISSTVIPIKTKSHDNQKYSIKRQKLVQNWR